MNGIVKWIGIRPERKTQVTAIEKVFADKISGLSGDHDTKPHRQITLISYEALLGVAKTLGKDSVDPALTRRNILISGLDINMKAGTKVKVGEALIEVTGPCLPCSRMDENLGPGGRDAMAEAGGFTGKILESGQISIGDVVTLA